MKDVCKFFGRVPSCQNAESYGLEPVGAFPYERNESGDSEGFRDSDTHEWDSDTHELVEHSAAHLPQRSHQDRRSTSEPSVAFSHRLFDTAGQFGTFVHRCYCGHKIGREGSLRSQECR